MKGTSEMWGGACRGVVVIASALGIAALTWNLSARADETQQSKFLICADSVAPAGCDASTAITVLVRPAGASDVGCGVRGPEVLSGSGLAAREGQYVKVVCAK